MNPPAQSTLVGERLAAVTGFRRPITQLMAKVSFSAQSATRWNSCQKSGLAYGPLYEISGSVDVTIHGGNGPDAADLQDSFPFVMDTAASTERPIALQSELTEVEFDTSSWHGEDDDYAGPDATQTRS